MNVPPRQAAEPHVVGAANEGLKFSDVLECRRTTEVQQRKGDRTRDSLKAAAVAVLETVGYRKARIIDICSRARVSTGSFYSYYDDKEAITADVLGEFLKAIFTQPHLDRAGASSFELVRRANVAWISAARANSSLVRCLLQLSDEVPEFAALHQRCSFDWHSRVASSILKQSGNAAISGRTALLIAYSLGAMMDELVRRLFVAPDHRIQDIHGGGVDGDEELAEFTALIWHRTVFGCDPADALSGPARELADASRKGTPGR